MKPRVLVVDDDHSVCESLRKLLEAQNYEVFPARNAREALDQFDAYPVDLVVVDTSLDADSGWKVLEAMTARNPFVPTIVISAGWRQRDQVVRFGAEGLVDKPIDVPAFLKLIHELLTEATEAKLKRNVGKGPYCRHIGRRYEPSLGMARERYAAQSRMASGSEVLTDVKPDVASEWPTVSPASAGMHGGPAESDRDRS